MSGKSVHFSFIVYEHIIFILFFSAKKNDEICDVVYVEMNKNRYIISVGWDKRINIYSDSQTESNIHHVQHPNIVWADDVVSDLSNHGETQTLGIVKINKKVIFLYRSLLVV